MIIVAFNTGMRLGELRKLKWSYIDREAGVIRLPEDATKEKKAKIIPINHHVNKVLSEIPRALKHNFVFTHEGERIKSKNGIKRPFKTACKNAGISCGRKIPDGIIFHDIRRTVKTNMLNAGVDKVHRDMILGHSFQGMDVHYLVPDEEVLKQAMNKYTRWMDEQLASAKVKQGQNAESD